MTNGICPQDDFEKLCESMNLPTPEFKSISDFTPHTQVVFEFHEDMEETALQLLSAFETRLKKSASRKTSKDENRDNTVSGMIEARKRIMRSEIITGIQQDEKANSNNPFSLISQSKNKISALMEYAQKKKMALPVFDELPPTSNSPFSCKCSFNSISDIGIGTSKKSAKEDSARLILLKLDIKSDSVTKRVKPSPSVEDLTTRFSNTNIGEKDIVSKVNEWCQKRQIPIPIYIITEHDLNLKSASSMLPQNGSHENICMTDGAKKKPRNKVFSCVGKYKKSNYHVDHPFSSSRILDSTARMTEHFVEGDNCNSKKEAKKNCAKKLYTKLVEEKK